MLSAATDRLVVVDNASANGDALRQHLIRLPHVEFVPNDRNRGVAHAVNQAIAIASDDACRYFIAFDQDSLPRVGAIELLRDRHEQLRGGRPVAAIGCRQIDTHSGRRMPFFRFHGFRKELVEQPDDGLQALCETDFLITSGTMISLDAIRETGAMDEKLFIDYVDTEWSFRARQAGYRLMGAFDAEMLHTIGERRLRIPVIRRSFLAHDPSRQFYMTRNRLLLYRRSHIPLPWKIQDAARAAIKLSCYVAFTSERLQYVKETLRGVWAAARKSRTRRSSSSET